MSDVPSNPLGVRDSLLRDTGRDLAKELGRDQAHATKLSGPAHTSASEHTRTREFLNALPFYQGAEPVVSLPTRELLARIYGDRS